MPLRRLLHENPGLTTAISIGLLLLSLGLVAYYLWTRNPQRLAPPRAPEPATERHAADQGCHGSDAAQETEVQ